MAAARSRRKTRAARNESPVNRFNHEILGILIVCSGIMFALALYSSFDHNMINLFGRSLKVVFIGLFSYSAYMLPVLLIIFGLAVLLRKNGREMHTRMLYILFFCSIVAGIIHTFAVSDTNTAFSTRTFSVFFYQAAGMEGVLSSFNSAMELSGGIVGGLVATPFLRFFGIVGTTITLLGLTLIFFILATNISFIVVTRFIAGIFMKIAAGIGAALKKGEDPKILAQNEKEEAHNASAAAKTIAFRSLMKATEKVGEEKLAGKKVPDDDLTFDFENESKIIDLNIQRTSRELRDKTGELELDDSKAAVRRDKVLANSTSAQEVSGVAHPETTANMGNAAKVKNKSAEQKGVAPISMETLESIVDSTYRLPPVTLLNENPSLNRKRNGKIEGPQETARKLEETLASFGVEAKVINVSTGPVITRYELSPSVGVKVSKIVNLADDIALNLAAAGVRIEAPIPGKAAVGIEVPNKETIPVFLREVIDSPEFRDHPSKVSVALGKDISGLPIIADLARMPHVLIAGATGSGKSVCINALITSLMFKAKPDEVKLLMVDPKVVELGMYNGIPHLLIPVVTDARKAAGALNWAVQEMVNRYKLFADNNVRDLKGYNAHLKEKGEEGILPQIVIIIDELADLMMVASNEVEDAICRLAQMARAAGMHLVIATQRPSVDVITGVIKANIPSRISFAVSSQVDSRTILDMAGAEKLLGKGDMLYFPIGQSKPLRMQCCFVSDDEVEDVVQHVKGQMSALYNADMVEEIMNSEKQNREEDESDRDELLPQAIELVVEAGQASTSLIQRRFKVGYARAGRMIDQMQERGIIGGFEGSKPRQVLITKEEWQQMCMRNDD